MPWPVTSLASEYMEYKAASPSPNLFIHTNAPADRQGDREGPHRRLRYHSNALSDARFCPASESPLDLDALRRVPRGPAAMY